MKLPKCVLLQIFVLGIFIQPLSAQKLEIRGSINSGLFYFSGNDAASSSFINAATYTNAPYGKKSGLSYGGSFNFRIVTPSNFLFGGDIAYERLRSKVKLRYDDVIGDIASSFKGRTFLDNSFINAFPYLGFRFLAGNQPIDLVGGLDIAYLLSSKEKGDARSIDNAQFHIQTSVDRKNMQMDFRPRLQVSTDVDKFGLYIGYSYGLKNYEERLLGATPKAYARMIRLGVSYRIK